MRLQDKKRYPLFIDTNDFTLSKKEYRIIRAAMKDGFAKGSESGLSGTVTSASYSYSFEVLTAFLKSEKGHVCATPVPATLETEWNGALIRGECVTDYLFRNEIVFRVTSNRPTKREFTFCVPSFAKEAVLNGASLGRRRRVTVSGVEAGTSECRLIFSTVPHLVHSADTLYYVECGSMFLHCSYGNRARRPRRGDRTDSLRQREAAHYRNA